MNDIARFQFSTEEDLSFVLEFSGLDLSGRQFEIKIKDRNSDVTRATLANGAGITIEGTNVLEAVYAKGGMVGWPRGEYSADVVDVTGGAHSRIMAVRFVYGLPGRLVEGVRDRKAFISWGPNQAVVTATGSIGPAGPPGLRGWAPELATVNDGPRRVLQVVNWIGGAGDPPVNTGYIGATGIVPTIGDAIDVRGAAGLDGTNGTDGTNGDDGWSPVFAIVTDGARRVLQVSDWTGGQGDKPATGYYVGSTGLTPTIAAAVDIRGPAGTASIPDGDKGDITTSAGGDVWTIDNGAVGTAKLTDGAVTFAKLQDIATARLLGRSTGGSGAVEALTPAESRSMLQITAAGEALILATDAATQTALLSPMVGDAGAGGAKGLVPAPAAGDASAGKFMKADGTWAVPTGGAPGSPIVILATGQSNVASQPALSWTPPPNLFIWGWDNANDTDIGTAFSPAPNNRMGLATGYGEQVALANPGRQVYLINIGKGSQAIAQWKTGAAAPDMFKACEQNVEAALAVLGLSKIDMMLWWQGESDAATGVNNQNYPADFETVVTRFRGQPWFPRETPIAIMALSKQYVLDDTLVYGNHWLRECAAFEPETRVFVDTSVLGASYWDAPTSNLHMTGAGYRAAGELAFDALEHGRGQNRTRDPRQVRYKKFSQNRSNSTTLTDDPELRVWIRSGSSYRIKFSVVCFAPAAADFKHGLAHGTSNLVIAAINTRTGGVGTVGNFVTPTIPSGGTVEVSSDQYFFVDIDIFVNVANADGWCKFQWAQNTSNASPVYVFAGSYVEAIELR